MCGYIKYLNHFLYRKIYIPDFLVSYGFKYLPTNTSNSIRKSEYWGYFDNFKSKFRSTFQGLRLDWFMMLLYMERMLL